MPLYVGPVSLNSSNNKKVTQNNNTQKPQPKKEEPKPGAARRAWNWLGYQAKYTAAFWANVAFDSSVPIKPEEVSPAEAASTFILAGLALNPIAWMFMFTGCAGGIAPESGDPVQGEVHNSNGDVVQDLASNATTGSQVIEIAGGEEGPFDGTISYSALGGVERLKSFRLFNVNSKVAGHDYRFTNPAGDTVTISIPAACSDYYADKEGFQFVADPSFCESTLDGDTTNDLDSESIPTIIDGWFGWCDTGYETIQFDHITNPPSYSLPIVMANVSPDGTVSHIGFGIPGEAGYIPSRILEIPIPAECTRNDGAVPMTQATPYGTNNALDVSWPVVLPWATFFKAQAVIEPK